jgi:hypothetical protein
MTDTTAAVRKSIVVSAPVEKAFAVFTGVDSDEGWPLYLTRYADLVKAG